MTVPIAALQWYRLQCYAWYRFSAIVTFLTLTYKTDEDGKLTNENITASGYKLNLIGSSSATYSIISKYLGVDWNQILKFINTRSDIAFAPTM